MRGDRIGPPEGGPHVKIAVAWLASARRGYRDSFVHISDARRLAASAILIRDGQLRV